MGPLHEDVVELVGIDSQTPAGDDDTLLSPALQPGVLTSPEAQLRRMEIEAALFGTATEALSLGRFRLLQRLGEGGMGTVYAAFDDRLDRKVAVKLLRQSRLDNEELRERTLREARALARLSHPNVVHVYEVGEIEDQLFVAMEFLAGPTLRAWLDEATRSWQEVLTVFRQAGEGLVAAHAEGIVHRDFKPHNVMFGADGRVRVLDFGLARVGGVQAQRGPAQERVGDELTQTGAVLGTPAYMAPEQFEGRTADVRTDQFAFCVTLYEALYGERPFTGRTLNELADAVKHAKIDESPSGSSVPTWLRKVVLRGLERAPDKRFESMPALLDALGNDPALRRRKLWTAAGFVAVLGVGAWGVLGSEQAEAQMCTGMEDKLAGVWDDERRAEVETAIEATGLNYAADTAVRVERALDDYTQAWVAARTEACEATQRGTQSGELLDLRMACLDERLVYVRETVDVLAQADATVVSKALSAVEKLPALERCADVAALTAELPPPEDPELAKRVAELDERLPEAKVLRLAGKYEQSLAIANAVVTEAEALGHEPLRARAWLEQGYSLGRNGNSEAAKAAYERAFGTSLGLGMTEVAANAATALIYVTSQDLGRVEEGRSWATVADPLSRAAESDGARWTYLTARGSLAQSEGEYDVAHDHHEQAAAIVAKLNLPSQHANELFQLGWVATAQGKYDVARDYCERGLSEMQEALGPRHPDMVAGWHGLAGVYWGEADYARAILHEEQALTIVEDSLGSQHPKAIVLKVALASLVGEQGDYARAVTELQGVLPIQEQINPQHPYVAMILNNLGALERYQGHYEEAREYGERALAIYEETEGHNPADLARTLMNLCWVAVGQGDDQRARELGERALTINEAALGPENASVASSSMCIGEALVGLGKPVEALPHLERALAFHGSQPVDPVREWATSRFALARALWDAPANAGRDRTRARELALLARDACVEAGKKGEPKLVEIDAWLADHTD